MPVINQIAGQEIEIEKIPEVFWSLSYADSNKIYLTASINDVKYDVASINDEGILNILATDLCKSSGLNVNGDGYINFSISPTDNELDSEDSLAYKIDVSDIYEKLGSVFEHLQSLYFQIKELGNSEAIYNFEETGEVLDQLSDLRDKFGF
jgi:hypothetical protein